MGQPAPPETSGDSGERKRVRLTIRGVVQGVGFRPYIYRLATELRLAGWVKNSPLGVFAEVEGHRDAIEQSELGYAISSVLTRRIFMRLRGVGAGTDDECKSPNRPTCQ